MNSLRKLTICAVLGSLVLTSCEKEKKNEKPGQGNSDSYAMFIVTDPNTSSGFIAPFDNMPAGDIDISNLDNVMQLASVRSAGISFEDAVYHTSSMAGDPGIQKLELGADGRFKDAGFIPSNSQYAGGNMFGLATATKGYYSNDALSQTALQIFNPTTMERTGEIDCSAEINKYETDKVVSTSLGGFVVERDGKVFTEVYYSDENGMGVFDSTFVAVVDVATNTLDKIIIWPDFLLLGYGFKNTNYINLDENGDLYLGSFIGNFGEMPSYRLLRIKSGETDFDKSFNLNSLEQFGGPNFALGGLPYKGKIYVKMFSIQIPPTFEGMEKMEYYAYEIDPVNQTATKIEGIPAGYWRSVNGPAMHDGKIYFVVENDEEGKAFYYSYDPETKEVAKEITVIGGQPQQIVKMTSQN